MVRQLNDIADSQDWLLLIQGYREFDPILIIDSHRTASGFVTGKHLIFK